MLKSYLSRLGGAFLTSRRGATAIEYGLLAALVASAIAVAVGALGTQLDTTIDSVTTSITPKT